MNIEKIKFLDVIMRNKKIIIWGHKNNGHTHGHIHSSYFKAFKYMGFETYWFDNNENVSGFNFDNSIFFTEDQVQSNIPLNKTDSTWETFISKIGSITCWVTIGHATTVIVARRYGKRNDGRALVLISFARKQA